MKNKFYAAKIDETPSHDAVLINVSCIDGRKFVVKLPCDLSEATVTGDTRTNDEEGEIRGIGELAVERF